MHFFLMDDTEKSQIAAVPSTLVLVIQETSFLSVLRTNVCGLHLEANAPPVPI